jgi:8-oxo-dGTP diphosphatase
MTARATIYLVRHAKAGERRSWMNADEKRPLSKKGWKQAEAVADRLEAKTSSTLVSSPFVRCVQTLEPLAKRLGSEVAIDDRLAEGEDFEPVLELIATLPGGSVLCTHGDIVPAVIQALHRRGMEIQTPPDWRKATIWVLRRKDSQITKGKVWPPTRE